MSMDALVKEVLGQVRVIARDVLRREGTVLRTATVTAVSPLLIRYDGETEASVVSPRSVAPVGVGDRVVVAKAKGQATVLGSLAASAWQPLTLVNGWLPYTGGGYYPGARARITDQGLQIQAMVRSGGVGDLAILPTAMQPKYTVTFPVTAPGGATGQCSVAMSGGAMMLRYGGGGVANPAFIGIDQTVPLD